MVSVLSAAKRESIVKAAWKLFLEKGYDATSMDDIATLAQVSKPTVYNHFRDKESLFAAVVGDSTDNIEKLVSMITQTLSQTDDLGRSLLELSRQFLTALMRPDMLRLRRMVIANSERFPKVGSLWYEQGFGRVLSALAKSFDRLVGRGLLRAADMTMAANHFAGLLLWIPVNRAMFTGDHRIGREALERHAESATRAFLALYGADRAM
jgi:TetR/AcrR family transcriptional repressor of mexJK operon